MVENMQHFQHIMLYYFKKSKNATEMQKRISAVYGEGAVTEQMCQKWFVKFHARDFWNPFFGTLSNIFLKCLQ